VREIEEPTDEAIRLRAYEISQRANGGSPEENWRRAKQELRDEAWAAIHRKPPSPNTDPSDRHGSA
jgi:hypothetical protein